MSINPNTEYPGRMTAPSLDYPYGSSKNETSPGAGDGSPYELARADDIFGLQQALLRSAGIVPSGNADTALASEYLQAIIELAQGRAINYDETGIANAYVLAVQTNQQAPDGLFDGLRIRFTPSNANTGASTIDLTALGGGIVNLKNNDGNDLTADYLNNVDAVEGIYNSVAGEIRLDRRIGGEYIKLSESQVSGTDGGTFTSGAWQTRTLNTEDTDTGNNCALSINQFTLDAGTYLIKVRSPAQTVNVNKARLYNISDAAVEISGSNNFSSDAANYTQADAVVIGQFTISSAKIFEVQHRCAVTKPTNGFGIATSLAAVNEIYTTVELWKVN